MSSHIQPANVMSNEHPIDAVRSLPIALSVAPKCPPAWTRTVSEHLGFVRTLPLFNGLPESAFDEIAGFARRRVFAREELLFLQGHQAVSLIVLQSGCVKHTQIGTNGTEVLLRFSGAGDVVGIGGESALTTHHCSARAMEATRALSWDRQLIANLMLRYPQLGNNMIQILYRRIEELEERFREMATEKIARRLSLVLTRLVDQIGKPSDGGIQICIRREELAQMTGSTIFTISRLLSSWSERGLVVPRRESVVICSPALLKFEILCPARIEKSPAPKTEFASTLAPSGGLTQ